MRIEPYHHLTARSTIHLLTTSRSRDFYLSVMADFEDGEVTVNPSTPAINNDATEILQPTLFSGPDSNKRCSPWFHPAIFFTIASHVHTWHRRCDDMKGEYFDEIKASCPSLQMLDFNLQNSCGSWESSYVLDYFPQSWQCLITVRLQAAMLLTREGILSVASCCQV